MIDNRDCCDHGDNINNQEVNIDYPCEWLYKVIGSDKESVHNVVAGIINDREYLIHDSNTSRSMKNRILTQSRRGHVGKKQDTGFSAINRFTEFIEPPSLE